MWTTLLWIVIGLAGLYFIVRMFRGAGHGAGGHGGGGCCGGGHGEHKQHGDHDAPEHTQESQTVHHQH